MSTSQEIQTPKKSGRGKIVIISFASVIGLSIALISIIPPEQNAKCDFKSSTEQGGESSQTSVILAPTANFVDFSSVVDRASADVKEALGESIPDADKKLALGRELSIVVADSSPSLIVNSVVSSPGTTSQDISRAIKTTFGDLDKAASCAAGDLKQPEDQIPTEDETDMLSAMFVASDQFNTLEDKNLFILGNGIQTSGAILMQDGGSFPKDSASAKLLAKNLSKRGDIPDLTDVKVTWYGLGQVDGEYQKPLPIAKAKALQVFWSEVIRLGGGSLENVCAQCGTGSPSDKSIKVTSVDATSCPVIVKLYESDGVEFEADSATFVSLSAATTAAEDTVAKFIAKKCDSISVSGFAASGEDQQVYESRKAEIDSTNKTLTKKRAAAFAKLLKSAGFEGEITYVGMGTCGTEWDSEGNAVENLQRLCRRVEVSN
jgi:hypothetical protein